MLKKKGFTLVELLAVIVILAMILAIAIPSVTSVVNNAKRNAFEQSTKMFLRAIDYKLMEDEDYDVTQIKKTATEDTIESVLKIDSSNYKKVTVTVVSNKPNVSIVGDNKWNGLTASGTKNNVTVIDTPVDTTPPVITLNGSATVQVILCYPYTELGATALDNVDGDITVDIVIDDDFSECTAGTFHATYNVTDSSGNAATQVTRTITVSAGGPM